MKPLLIIASVLLSFGCVSEYDTRTGGPSSSPDRAPALSIAFEPRAVVLDYRAREMEITGRLIRESGEVPTRVWIWAYFFNPAEAIGGSRSDEPIELQRPFAGSDTATVRVRAHFTGRLIPMSHRANVSGVSQDRERYLEFTDQQG